MERLKKAKVEGSRRSNSDEDCGVGGKCNGSSSSSSGAGSEGEEGYIFRAPLNTNDHSSRKRVKLQGKASAPDDYRPVDLAVVPRRLRSAMNKRLCQLVSPPLSDSKRKQLHSLNGTLLSNGYIAERLRQNMFDRVTEDEEEVAQALTMLIIPVTISKLIKNKEDLEEKSETKEVSASFSAALKETTTVLLPCNSSIGHNPSPCGEETHRDALKPETSAMEKQIAVSLSQNFDAGRNQTTPPDSCRTPLSDNGKEGDVASLRNAMNSSIPLGTSLQNLAGTGGLQQTQLGASSMHRCDIGLWPVGSNLMGHNLQSVKKKFYCEATPDTSHGFSSSVHGHLTITTLPLACSISSSSSKATGCQRSLTASARCSSTINDSLTERLSSIDGKAPRKKCATHVYISHLIRNYQNTEKGQQSMLPVDQLKAEEGTNYALQTANGMGLISGKSPTISNGFDTEKSSLQGNTQMLQGNTQMLHDGSPTISNGFHMEKSSLQGDTQMLRDGKLLQAQMISTLSGSYGQKKQGGELSVSAVVAKNSGSGSKSSEQFHVPYLPHHSLMPFPFPRGPYSSHYQDQLSAAASRQVQLQLPYFVGTSASYGPQMVHIAGGTTMKQQQQQQMMMWQAQMAYLRPPSGFPAKWQQYGQHSNSVSSSPSVFPSPKDNHPVNNRQHFLLPVPSSTSSLPSRAKQQQHQQNGVTLNLEASSTQLQVLCNAETYR